MRKIIETSTRRMLLGLTPLLLVGGLALPTQGCRSKPEEKAGTTEQAATHSCPMHPEVRQSTPGTCPECGMALEIEE